MGKNKCIKITDDALIAWAEMLEDMAKMVFVAIAPTLIVLDTKLKDSIINSLALAGFAILLLFLGLVLRNVKHNRKEK